MKRIVYILLFLILLTVEFCIAVYIHDDFIRPYVGDVLVTILLCCLFRSIFPEKLPRLPLYVLLFCIFVEIFQLFHIVERFEIKSGIIHLLLGSTFDWKDIICYAIGCVLFYAAEAALIKSRMIRSKFRK